MFNKSTGSIEKKKEENPMLANRKSSVLIFRISNNKNQELFESKSFQILKFC
jgi:hypothetical protein